MENGKSRSISSIAARTDRRQLATRRHPRYEAGQPAVARRVVREVDQDLDSPNLEALYDAPVDGEGQQIFAEIDPHDRVKTRSPKPVSIRYAATDTQFVIAVRDRFGRLAAIDVVHLVEVDVVGLQSAEAFVPGPADVTGREPPL